MMLVLRSFKVTQGQKLASKGQKGQISIFIKSSWNLHEKNALNVSFSVKWVKVIQGPTEIDGQRSERFVCIICRIPSIKYFFY